jgi:hypothetical protein
MEVINQLSKATGYSQEIALETYRLGMLVRAIALAEVEKKEECKQSKLYAIFGSEAFGRLALLAIIPLLRAAYGPVLKSISKAGR